MKRKHVNFKVQFRTTIDKSEAARKVINKLTNKGIQMCSYSTDHRFIIVTGCFFRTSDINDFSEEPCEELTPHFIIYKL